MSKIVCDNCGRAHPKVTDTERGMVISYHLFETKRMEERVPRPGEPKFTAAFRAACGYVAANWRDAPAWICNIGHWHGPPLVHTLAQAAGVVAKGDRAICDGVEYEWSGKQWEPRAERPMPRELLH